MTWVCSQQLSLPNGCWAFCVPEPFGFHRVFLQLCHCGWTRSSGNGAEEVVSSACLLLVKSWLLSLTHCFLGSRLLPSILEPAPCTLAGGAGEPLGIAWNHPSDVFVSCWGFLHVVPKAVPGELTGCLSVQTSGFREAGGSSGQRAWSAWQMEGPTPP